MSRKNKTYTEEFKKTLVDLLTNGKSIAEVSREYGVATSNLVGWKKLYTKLSPESDETVTLAEYKKMKKEMESIKEECEIEKEDKKYFELNYTYDIDNPEVAYNVHLEYAIRSYVDIVIPKSDNKNPLECLRER